MVAVAPFEPSVAARVDAFLNRPEEELYDLERDPAELVNLAADPAHRETLERMRAALLD